MSFLRILVLSGLLSITADLYSQLTGSGCPGITSYTNGEPNDTIYYYETPQTGDLTATAPSGIAPFTFTWSVYNAGTSSWELFLVETDPVSSTISNLLPAVYSVSVTDSGGNIVYCGNAWIAQHGGEATYFVDVLPIPPSCIGAHLQGIIDYEIQPGYSNVPSEPMFVDATTQMQICFTGTHTWVSDLAFYVVGPPGCGSPSVLLSPNPGSIGQGPICNSGDNINNLCFSTESLNNLNVCAGGAFTLQGTYGSYGPGSTPIDWSGLIGCEATSPGWAVQIYDCIGGDTGFLTDATLTFIGDDNCGNPQTISYTTPPGYSSFIADNSCTPQTASIFSVPPANANPPIECEIGYEWNSVPYVYIADSTTSLDFMVTMPFLNALGQPLNPQPSSVTFSLYLTSSCDSLAYSTEFGTGGCIDATGNGDSEIFVPLPWQDPFIQDFPPVCEFQEAFNLFADPPLGLWSGNGIVDNATGLFDPAVAGLGSHEITFEPAAICYYPSSTWIDVIAFTEMDIDSAGPVCIDEGAIALFASGEAVAWSGTGITDPVNGIFDPAVAGPGWHSILAEDFGLCGESETLEILVNDLPLIIANEDLEVCEGLPVQLNVNGGLFYSWFPSTYLNDDNNPNPTCTPLTDISYTVTGTDANGCSGSDDVSITLLPGPVFEVQPLPEICPGTTIELIASGDNGNYFWASESDDDIVNDDQSTAYVTPTETTTYVVTLTDNCGQEVQQEITVEVEPPVLISALADTYFCEGEQVTIEADIEGVYTSLLWTTANGLVNPQEEDQPSITVETEGIYTITVGTALGCSYSHAINVDEVPLPVVNINSPVELCPMSEVTLIVGVNWDAILWSNGANSGALSVTEPGIYNVTVTENGCQGEASIEVIQVVLPYLELGPDIEICDGQSEELEVDEPGYWNTGSFATSIVVTTAGTYGVTISEGPCSVSDTIAVQVNPLPVAYLGPDVTGCLETPVALSAYHPYNTAYQWNTGDTTSWIEVLEADEYFVEVSNPCGSAEVSVVVDFEDCSFEIFIPNTFTPDRDGINDVWKVSTFNIRTFELSIFNRWGDIIFHTNDPEAVWTGEVRDGAYYAPDGVYPYHVKFESVEGEAGERSGHVNIIR